MVNTLKVGMYKNYQNCIVCMCLVKHRKIGIDDCFIKIEKLISNAIIEHLSDHVKHRGFVKLRYKCCASLFEPSHRKSVVFTKNSFTNENAINKEVISEIRSLAAKAWLFNLLVVDAIPENFHTNFENLVFQLKNLGFCEL